MRKITALLLLAGCTTAPTGYWYRDGVRVDANPALFETFNRDRAICDGEAAQAALASNEVNRQVHSQNVGLVFDACLTRAGYIRRS